VITATNFTCTKLALLQLELGSDGQLLRGMHQIVFSMPLLALHSIDRLLRQSRLVPVADSPPNGLAVLGTDCSTVTRRVALLQRTEGLQDTQMQSSELRTLK
jgi:hypothetical protein